MREPGLDRNPSSIDRELRRRLRAPEPAIEKIVRGSLVGAGVDSLRPRRRWFLAASLGAAGVLIFSVLLFLAPSSPPVNPVPASETAPATIHLTGFGRVVAVATSTPRPRPRESASSVLIVATRSPRSERTVPSDPLPGENP